jgi:hypothetical protein
MQIWFHPLPHLRGDSSSHSKASIEYSQLSLTTATLRWSNGRLDTLSLLRRFYKSRLQQFGLGRRMKHSVQLRVLPLQLSGDWRRASLVKAEYMQRNR